MIERDGQQLVSSKSGLLHFIPPFNNAFLMIIYSRVIPSRAHPQFGGYK